MSILNSRRRINTQGSADSRRISILKTLHKEGGKALRIQGSADRGRISILKALHEEGFRVLKTGGEEAF